MSADLSAAGMLDAISSEIRGEELSNLLIIRFHDSLVSALLMW